YKIMYFIRDNRKVTVVTSEEKDAFYESLEKVYERVKQYDFLFIHKSYLINYRYIETIRYDSVTMTDGTEFSISQSRRKEIRKRYMEIMSSQI
ncbi:LytTR family transcriptional regulator DNA-binding domain-containing protein, partial [Agathobaculum butyriciproducens]|nr:LytTR family transcriptional regulator DNA-binding domain-containing protein [Agathobaculum butyriciproducens]